MAHGVPQGPVPDPPGGAVADAEVPLRVDARGDRRGGQGDEPGRLLRPRGSPWRDPRPGQLLRRPRRAEFPYQDIPERERPYLDAREKAHKDYLAGGWQIITKGLCVQCHAIGTYKPATGGQNVNGPDLRQVAPRFRQGYLYEWLAQPSRLVPYTAMPQNIPPQGPPPPGVPKSFEGRPSDQVRAMRDTLLNYVTAVEQQLASGSAKPDDAPHQGRRQARRRPGRQARRRAGVRGRHGPLRADPRPGWTPSQSPLSVRPSVPSDHVRRDGTGRTITPELHPWPRDDPASGSPWARSWPSSPGWP